VCVQSECETVQGVAGGSTQFVRVRFDAFANLTVYTRRPTLSIKRLTLSIKRPTLSIKRSTSGLRHHERGGATSEP
jgi:hypothetical protein